MTQAVYEPAKLIINLFYTSIFVTHIYIYFIIPIVYIYFLVMVYARFGMAMSGLVDVESWSVDIWPRL